MTRAGMEEGKSEFATSDPLKACFSADFDPPVSSQVQVLEPTSLVFESLKTVLLSLTSESN